MILGLEARQPEVHFAGCHRFCTAPADGFEPLDNFLQGVAGLGKENGHRESAVTIGKPDRPEDIIRLVAEVLHQLHHRDLLLRAGSGGKKRLGCGRFRELLLPLALEVHRIQQVSQHIGIHIVQDLGDKAVRVSGTPTVDGLQGRIPVGEIQVGHFGLIILLDRPLVTVQKGPLAMLSVVFLSRVGSCRSIDRQYSLTAPTSLCP